MMNNDKKKLPFEGLSNMNVFSKLTGQKFFSLVQGDRTPATSNWERDLRHKIKDNYIELRKEAVDKFNLLAVRYEMWRQGLDKGAPEDKPAADYEMPAAPIDQQEGSPKESLGGTQPEITLETIDNCKNQ